MIFVGLSKLDWRSAAANVGAALVAAAKRASNIENPRATRQTRRARDENCIRTGPQHLTIRRSYGSCSREMSGRAAYIFMPSECDAEAGRQKDSSRSERGRGPVGIRPCVVTL